MENPAELPQINPSETLSRRELDVSEQARIQATYKWAGDVLWDKEGIPSMVRVFPTILSPTRISESTAYWENLHKTLSFRELLDMQEKYEGEPLPISLPDGSRIETLDPIKEAVTTVVGNNIITIAYSTGSEIANVRMVAETLQKATETAASFGVTGIANNHILVLNNQFPILDSHCDPSGNVTTVGTRGIVQFDQSDILGVVAHEGTHPKFSFTIDKEFGIDPKERTSYAMEAILEFLDEGTAVLTQQAQLGTPARILLRQDFDKMDSKAKATLLKGDYTPNVVYGQNDDVHKVDPAFLVHAYQRDLPGAFVEYCISKGIRVQDLMGVIINKLNQMKPGIAEALGIEEQDVSLNWQQMLIKMKEKKGEQVTDDEERELREKVWKVTDEFDMRPFQVLAFVDGSNDEVRAAHDFLDWAEIKTA